MIKWPLSVLWLETHLWPNSSQHTILWRNSSAAWHKINLWVQACFLALKLGVFSINLQFFSCFPHGWHHQDSGICFSPVFSWEMRNCPGPSRKDNKFSGRIYRATRKTVCPAQYVCEPLEEGLGRGPQKSQFFSGVCMVGHFPTL